MENAFHLHFQGVVKVVGMEDLCCQEQDGGTSKPTVSVKGGLRDGLKTSWGMPDSQMESMASRVLCMSGQAVTL